ncbi:hypothetical protein FH968_00240 [Buttiauxella sp. B2]|uniref:transcriptional regulator n=1 Tax=Buttiauxella sp. B2 TaxID=2587812 RepID=UPI00112101FB|nr:winged helix-turn-helix domain-containing protein [Buttiauxella sp. B2]TNV22523.1 hypothetical protein FH968_00240 [Buttiauxella sp. B2]
MAFLINDLILADESGIRLKMEPPGSTDIKITNQSWRILALLVQEQGRTVSREILFKSIWEDFGLISSNSSLTQYVSLLRKAFNHLGLDEDLIITVPKVGFMVNPDISIIYVDDRPDTENNIDDEEYNPDHEIQIPKFKTVPENSQDDHEYYIKPPTMKVFGWILLSILLIASAIGAVLTSRLLINERISAHPIYLHLIDGCSIYSFKQLSEGEKQDYLAKINIFIKEKSLQCGKDTAILMYINDEPLVSGHRYSRTQTLYSVCDARGDSAKTCSNYIFSSEGKEL